MIKKLLVVVGALVAAVLLFALTRPNSLHVERTASIKAPPGKILPLIEDFHNWASWSPYEKKDPAMIRTFSGAAQGKGAVYEWNGNNDVGQGRMEILDVSPAKVTIKLDFLKPLEGHDIGAFTLTPHGDVTSVTWSMDGPTPYVGKLIGMFMNMDTMIGSDFESGLASLKTLTEK
jgi:hypothetical protein